MRPGADDAGAAMMHHPPGHAAGAVPLAIWRCPSCRGPVEGRGQALFCGPCVASYPLTGDIPDFRIAAPAWVDRDADRARAARLMELAATHSGAALAYEVFRRRQGWSERDARRRADGVSTLAEQMTAHLDGWVKPTATGERPLLDLGCGSGSLLAAAARLGFNGLGIDVSLEWLVVATKMIEENGGAPRLAAAMAEALPLADGTIGGVASLDVIEHVADQRQYLREIDRVLAPAGVCAVSTPNRFSFTPEPHVNLWGVGWLPHRWQAPYVRWRRNKPYEFCELKSLRGLRRMFAESTSLSVSILPGLVPPEELRRFSPLKAFVGRRYNAVAATAGLRDVVLPICPFFRVIARKPSR
jgi:SAM-dependent methyltransferase